MKTILTTLNAKYIHSSLALRYLRAFVQDDFPDIEMKEYTIKDPAETIVADLYLSKPDLIAFSVYIWNVEETLPILSMLKKILPNVKIVLGGPEVSYDTKTWMNRCPDIDIIVKGEGEATFHDVLTHLKNEQELGDVPGIVYRCGSEVLSTPARSKLDLDRIPSPFQNLDDVEQLRNRIVYFETSRGCPFSCQFCLSSIESGVRYFSLERVKRELAYLIDSGIRTIKFVDRTFNLNRQYALALFSFLIEHRGDTVFQFEITGDILPKEIVDFLSANAPKGLFRFEMGVQSTNDMTNALVKRRQNFTKLSQTIQSVKDSGSIVQHLDLIAGLPEEDYQSFRKTFNDVFTFEPDELQLGFLKMLRGTGMRLRSADFGYVYMDQAPYEIFSNNVLSYDDVLRIKQVEDVLEKYWNDGRLQSTVRYLTRHVFSSPFDFFQSFGAHWEARGWSRIGQQLEDLFLRLDGFLEEACGETERESAKSYMIHDFLLQFRIRPHKVWWDRALNRSARAKLAERLSANPSELSTAFAQLDLTKAELEKHAVIELLPSAIHPNEPHIAPEKTPGLLVMYYPPGLKKGDQPSCFLGSAAFVETDA